MAILTGELTDITQSSIAGLDPVIEFVLNRTVQHENRVVVAAPRRATISGTAWSVNLEPTFAGDWYTIRVIFTDRQTGVVQHREVLDRRVIVPEEGGTLGGLPSAVISPDTVAIQPTAPTNQAPFWLEATIGDPDPGTSTGTGDLYVWRD